MDINKKLVKMLKALADENRLMMIELLSYNSMCSCHFVEELEISQPNVSHHLKILKEAGLINATKRGRWIDYSLNTESIELIKAEINSILAESAVISNFKNYDCD
ncbi:ArsR/SmtB family transcription factor [Halanaerobium hydrogeniformans]|uniref:Regulatory protein ArsR n=1 Tax=Halanaerobium hydrogeniformans TaxID=656519 RepID=E4RJH6_HALHG|nr:metalloregulator ArsR/SmtB family transcription factor [Halanaerobium hydrogeniformans]ADQ15396.1 regulatory protein ArsR [Halanaerobium hydrogeniformans]